MRALLGVSVLIALLDADHAHHQIASAWLANNIEHGWASCPITQNGCVRIMSQPRYPNPVAINDVAARLAQACATTHHEFWSEDISLLDPDVVEHRRLMSARQITDVYLLALAAHNNGRFVTFDRAIPLSASRAATERNLQII